MSTKTGDHPSQKHIYSVIVWFLHDTAVGVPGGGKRSFFLLLGRVLFFSTPGGSPSFGSLFRVSPMPRRTIQAQPIDRCDLDIRSGQYFFHRAFYLHFDS